MTGGSKITVMKINKSTQFHVLQLTWHRPVSMHVGQGKTLFCSPNRPDPVTDPLRCFPMGTELWASN